MYKATYMLFFLIQFVASKAATLVKVLGKLEETCEVIAAFWTMQAENFDSQGAKMKTSQVVMLKTMKGVVIKNNLTFWTKAKADMDRYATAMSVINNSFNFVTEARRPNGEYLTLPAIDLTINLPPGVDTKAITV